MSKYRCPRCGATHKSDTGHCRLCGMDLSGTKIPASVPQARSAAATKRGLGGIAVFGVLGVLVVAALAVAFGLSGDDSAVGDITENIPGVRGATSDGWEPVVDETGGFVVNLPGTATQTTVPFPPAVDGQATTWTSTIADEIRITVAYADLPPLDDSSSDAARLEAMADEWAAANGTTVRDSAESDFSGLPALDTTMRDTEVGGEPANVRAFLFVRGDRLFVVMVESIFVDIPQYTRVLTSLSLS